MKKNFYLILAYVLLIPQFVMAAQGAGNDGGGTAGSGNPGGSSGSSGDGVSLQNPLKSDSLLGFFQSILDAIMVFAVPIIVFFIIYAGFLYVMARGNADGVGKAHRALLYAVIGGLIILGAQIILSIISATVSAF